MKEPSESGFFARAAATGIIVAIGFSIWIGSIPSTDPESGRLVINTRELTPSTILMGLGAVLGGLIALIFAHETVHLLAHPKNGLSRDSILGFLPKRVAFYAFYDGQMTRNRFILMVAAPFLAISVLPGIVFTFIGPPPVWFGLIMFTNALLSGGDLVALWLVLKRLPKNSLVRHQSWDAYWKPIE